MVTRREREREKVLKLPNYIEGKMRKTESGESKFGTERK